MPDQIDHLQINGTAKPISELFAAVREFTVEYYQREYAWTKANVEELINDLLRSFLAGYEKGHPRKKVAGYTPYFLGPIVTYSSEGVSYLVDGQQRVTTLSLLLMYLKQIAEEEDQKNTLAMYVYSTKYGTPSFRMNVEGRDKVMRALLEENESKPDNLDSSSDNIWERFQDIERLFPEELTGEALPYFIDWLQHRVVLVEITTPDKNMALEIFESMNDRGLQLSNMDMLKSYFLSRIEDSERIELANSVWRDAVNDLRESQKNGDAEFMKTFLRAKFAETVREAGRGKTPKQFEDIGTAFHKWVREQVEPLSGRGKESSGLISLRTPEDFEVFVVRDFKIHSSRYRKLLEVSSRFTPGWEFTYYNARNDFTLQYMLALAVSEVQDDEETFRQKNELVAKYIDLMVTRRMVNLKRRGYSSMYRLMFALAKSIRGLGIEDLRLFLSEKARTLEESFEALPRFALNPMNKQDVYYLLSRITSWLEDDRTGRYLKGGASSEPFEVEHVWANKFERHQHEFATEDEFRAARNRFGALLLLPKSFNASYGALDYGEKAKHYINQNALAQTLVQGEGSRNPNLRRKVEQLGMPLKAYPTVFDKAAIDERQHLYQVLCESIWSLETLGLDATRH
jgi:uncharacterized protein with ParB-like and HNH nuclease domain